MHGEPSSSLPWQRIFRREMRWHRQVKKEVSRRETWPNPDHGKLRSKVYKGLVSALLFRFWSSARGQWVFVSFGRDPMTASVQSMRPQGTVRADSKIGRILRGQSLCELDALNLLLIHPDLFSPFIRKLFIGWLVRWVEGVGAGWTRHVFFTKHDYYEKSSLLVTLAEYLPISLIGIQHGLLRHRYLASTDTYPGYRNRIEAVYDEQYRDLLKAVKPDGAKFHVLGPPFDSGCRMPSTQAKPTIIFISSGDLQSPERRQAMSELMKTCASIHCQFFIRPHPEERPLLSQFDFPYAQESKEMVLSRDPEHVVFIGFFSTLLYEAAHRGFRTVWMARSIDQPPALEFPEIKSLPNAQVHDPSPMSSEWLEGLFSTPKVAVPVDQVSHRIALMVETLFPPMR